jgi:hypothetical protein
MFFIADVDFDTILADLHCLASPPATIEILIAPERKTKFSDKDGPIHLHLNQLQHML